jgi:signal transduction histidine kinase
VELTVELDDVTFAATVADSGIGIAPEHLTEICESFWQAEPTYTRERGGTGLGLSVARPLTRIRR